MTGTSEFYLFKQGKDSLDAQGKKKIPIMKDIWGTIILPPQVHVTHKGKRNKGKVIVWHFTNEKVAEPVWSIHKNAIYDNMLSYASVHKFNIYLFIYLVGLTSTNNWLKLHPIFFLLREFTLHAPLNFISPKYNTYYLWEIYVSWALTKQVANIVCVLGYSYS